MLGSVASNLPKATLAMQNILMQLQTIALPKVDSRLLASLPQQQQQRQPPRQEMKDQERTIGHAISNGAKVLSRPVSVISGRRYIPKLVNANGIPFLRFKKPQSPCLSGIIRHKVKRRQKLFHCLHALKDSLVLARQEDQWDEVLFTRYGISEIGKGFKKASESSWVTAISDEMGEISRTLRDDHAKSCQIARKMFDIIQKEKALAQAEKVQRSREKKSARRLRRVANNRLLHFSSVQSSLVTQ